MAGIEAGRPGAWVPAPGYRGESLEAYGARIEAAGLEARRRARADPFADMDDADAARILAQLSSAPAKPAQLAHKPDKLATCSSCRGVLNEQTGECKCSD